MEQKYTKFMRKNLRICKWLWVVIPIMLVNLSAFVSVAEDTEDLWRCNISASFGSIATHNSIEFIINLQIKNTTGRDVVGVSVVYMDINKEVRGNVSLDCGAEEDGVKPGSYGECSAVLDRVDLSVFSSSDSIILQELIQSKINKYLSVQYCNVLGYTY